MTDLHRWAHVQITGSLSSPVDVIARDQPERILSRLVCRRKLVADTPYIACLVPTYNVGVDAGLGRDVASDATLADAWGPTTTAIELPVYYHWEFSTGNSGDFKSLVTRLQARTDLPGVGTRVLDITTPGFGVEPRAATTTVDLGGALRVTPPAASPVDDTLADELLSAIGKDGLTPPIYGRWHAGGSVARRSTATPGWLEGLNLDPRYRVAAGLGTKVVQDRQEDLMAAIWEQFGEILRANQILRHAQLAVAASERIVARHLWSLPDLDLLAVTGPAFGRIRLGTRRTVRRTVVESCAPIVAFSGAFRRLVRTRGPLVRRMSRSPGLAFPDLPPAPATRRARCSQDSRRGRGTCRGRRCRPARSRRRRLSWLRARASRAGALESRGRLASCFPSSRVWPGQTSPRRPVSLSTRCAGGRGTLRRSRWTWPFHRVFARSCGSPPTRGCSSRIVSTRSWRRPKSRRR